MIRFSIVIPFFNREKYLGKAIRSVLDQNYPNWELILVDDCSTDSSLEIAKSFTDPRIQVLSHRPNRGNAFTRNEGWKSSNYSWIAYLDSDDWYEPDYLDRISDSIKENPEVGFFWTGVRFVKNEEKSLKEEFWKPLKALPSDTFFDQLRIGTNAGVCFSKRVLDQFEGFEETLRASVDREFFLRISQTVRGQGVDFLGVNCLIGTHESVRKSYKHQAEAYDFFCLKYKTQIESNPKRKQWWYHKAMWLNLYSKNLKKSQNYLSQMPFCSRSILVFFIFLIMPYRSAIKIHKKISRII